MTGEANSARTERPRPVFLAVRPRDRWTDTTTAFAELDIDLIFADVIDYVPVAHTLPDPSEVDGVIVSSLRAVLNSPECCHFYQEKSLYVVGESTANTLKEKGFAHIEAVATTGAALCAVLAPQGSRRYLYLRGDEVAVDFEKELAGTGARVQSVVTYCGVPQEVLEPYIIHKIKSKAVTGILFFSAQSARVFADLAQAASVAGECGAISALCLSQAVLESVQNLNWAQTACADAPDLTAMGRTVALVLDAKRVESHKKMSNNSQTPETTEMNVDWVIEQFGGIRPMAAKTGIAVTTVQGWKKRGMIPENRRAQIQVAARSHGIDLLGAVRPESGSVSSPSDIPPTLEKIRSMIIEDHGAVHDDRTASEAVPEEQAPVFRGPVSPEIVQGTPARDEPPPFKSDPVKPRARGAQASWIAVMILAFAVLIGLLAMGPGVARLWEQERRLSALERELAQTQGQVQTLQGQNALLSGALPEAAKKEVQILSERAKAIEETVSTLGQKTRAITEGVMGASPGTIDQRLSKIETEMGRVRDQTQKQQLEIFLAKIQQWQSSPEGRRTIASVIAAMHTAMGEETGMPAVEEKIRAATKTMPDLKQVFTDLSGDEIKIAITILALTDLRQKLDRGGVPFDRSLVLVQAMMPAADLGALKNDMASLVMRSKVGVATPDQLKTDFTALAPGIVSADLSASETPLTKTMMARLHDVLKVERAGRPLTGTPVQQAVDRAMVSLRDNDLGAAVVAVQGISGPAADVLAPWVARAEQTLAAHRAMDLLTKMVSARISMQSFTIGDATQKSRQVNPDDMARGLLDNLMLAPAVDQPGLSQP